MVDVVQSLIAEFWNVLAEMSPYLLFGFFVAGVLSVLISPEAVERHLGGAGMMPVAKSALFGVPLPLCSCGVIPVAASLRRHGATRGATTAFLLSTPQTGVDSIFVTFSLLGLTFAVFRPVAAFATGLLGGWLVTLLIREDRTADGKVTGQGVAGGRESRTAGKFRQFWRYGFVDLPRDIGKALLVGLVIAGAISVAVPNDYFAGILGTGFGAKLVMMAVGIPVYVCATGSVPIAAALIAKGISPGAALVFLMTGPATNAATIATVWRTMGKKTAIIYLASVALCALGSGMLLDYIFTVRPETIAMTHVHSNAILSGYVNPACAVVLLAILAYALLWPSSAAGSATASAAGVRTMLLKIGGMTCSHCVETVQRALSECAGVSSARVDLQTGIAVVAGDRVDSLELTRAVESVGYSVEKRTQEDSP
jgi:hypothetical protein